jgi:hypothetical protein
MDQLIFQEHTGVPFVVHSEEPHEGDQENLGYISHLIQFISISLNEMDADVFKMFGNTP